MKTELLDGPLESQLRMLLDRDIGFPGELFTDPLFFAVERERVFMRTWLCVGLSSDVPRHGHVHPVEILNVPLLVVRDGGAVRVFHNVCSHRGARLVNEPCGGRVRVVCPYHGWTYGLDGSLLKTPHVAGAKVHQHDDWDPKTLGLVPVRCAEWAGHVFVDLSGDAGSFESWIEPIAARLALPPDVDLARDQDLAQRLEVATDWKIIVENFVESYHLPWVHHELNRVNPMERHYQILGGHYYLGQGGDDYEGQQLYGAELPTLRKGGNRSDYEALYIFPNLIL
ncbi:MAG: aromatic ring-hydroxylating oxygenase subunit alpha, partial [Steroidobacteraceae bacterium]